MAEISNQELVLTTVVVLSGACTDLLQRRIPNWLTLPALVLLLSTRFLLHGWVSCMHALLASLLAGGVFLLLFLVGGMGGGDVKLIAAAAAGVGLSRLPALLVFTALAGGVMAVVAMIRYRRTRQTLANVGSLLVHHASSQAFHPHPELNLQNQATLRLPYAIAIAAGTVLALTIQGVG